MDKPPTVDEALAGLFDKPKPRLKLVGGLDFNERTGKLDGAHLDVTLDEQKPEPPIEESQ